MSKKILIISPTPTHPQNAGNRIRIYNMVSFLISQGHEVFFLYSNQEDCDEDGMRHFWGDRYFQVKYKKPKPTEKQLYYKKIKTRLNKHYQYYTNVDDQYNLLLDQEIQKVAGKISFDIVMVEYIFLSKAFLNFDKKVLKVIDTHDVMTNRHKLFLREGKKPIWYSTTKCQERKGIKRADVIIAIQEHEKQHFSRLANRKIVNVGHVVKLEPPVSDIPRKKLLFVGSNNPSNLYGINDFLSDIFNSLREKYHDLELIIAGNICDKLDDHKGVLKLGVVENLDEAYDMADIVINPLTIGTGLKIKMIEALGYSKAVLSTDVGAEGLEEGKNKSYLVTNTLDDYLKALNVLFTDQQKYNMICREAGKLADSWNQSNYKQLENIFNQ